MAPEAERALTVVDSGGWLAFFGGEANASFVEAALVHPDARIVPALTLYGVGIWQTAQVYSTKLYTQDAGLRQMPHVMYKDK